MTPKMVQKVTQKGHFLTLFGSLFGPPFGHVWAVLLDDLDQKGCPKSDPKRSLLRVILDLHFDPLLVVHAGYAWDSASSITVPVQEVSKR